MNDGNTKEWKVLCRIPHRYDLPGRATFKDIEQRIELGKIGEKHRGCRFSKSDFNKNAADQQDDQCEPNAHQIGGTYTRSLLTVGF